MDKAKPDSEQSVVCISELLGVKDHEYIVKYLAEHWRDMNFRTVIPALLKRLQETIDSNDEKKQDTFDMLYDDYNGIIKDHPNVEDPHSTWCSLWFFPKAPCDCIYQLRLFSKQIAKYIIDCYYDHFNGTNSKNMHSAQRKSEKPGLCTHEVRMFNEKFVFLNKSTAKYIIIGNDPIDFNVVVRICDIVTGTHVSMPGATFSHFLSHLIAAYDGSYSLDSLLRGVDIEVINDLFWIKTEKNSIALHNISVENLIAIPRELVHEIKLHEDCRNKYKRFFDKYRSSTAGLDSSETSSFLRRVLAQLNRYSDREEHTFLFDLIVNRDYLYTLEKYKINFFDINEN